MTRISQIVRFANKIERSE